MTQEEPSASDLTESLVADSSSYELLKKRLSKQGEQLRDKTLNVRDKGAGRLGTGSWLGGR